MKTLTFIISAVLTFLLTCAYATGTEDRSILGDDFATVEETKSNQMWLIGEVIDSSFRVVHTNDEDLFGFLHKSGLIPKDDDMGRTAALLLAYRIVGERGRIDVNLNNQLFARISDGYTDDDDVQDILEETSLSVVARVIHNEDKKTYFIVGVNYTNLLEKPLVMTYLQDFVHEMGAGTPRTSLNGERNEHFARAIVGAGKTFQLVKKRSIAVSISTEFTTEIATRVDQTRTGFSISGTIEIGGWRDSNDPVFVINAEGNAYAHFDRMEFWAKIELITRLKFKKDSKWYLELTAFVAYYDTELDNEFEGGPSFQTGISIRITRGRERRNDDPFLF